MQKKAARRGQRALAFLLCLLMVVTLLPVMGASAAEGDVSATGVELDKTLTLQNDGTYAITLEAYATGTVTTTTVTEPVPTDFVLVLDQSGSMAQTLTSYTYTPQASQGYSYNNLYDQTLYYKDGDTYYQVSRHEKNGKYYLRYEKNDTKYYLTSDGTTTDRSNASYASSKSGTIWTGVLYTRTESSTRKLDALISAVTNFAASIRDQKDPNGKPINHRVAIVGFSSDGYNNTELLTGVTIKHGETNSMSTQGSRYSPDGKTHNGVQYGSITPEQYAAALQDVTTSAGQTSITNAINALTAHGGTQPQDGLEMANQIFANRKITTYQKADGTSAPRNTVVVMFTDGQPGNNNQDDRIAVANSTIAKAKTAKETYQAKVFTIGVFDGSDENKLVSEGKTSSYSIKDYMTAVSSDYPAAESLSSKGTANTDGKEYYAMATDSEALNAAFQSVSSSVNNSSTSCELDTESVLTDVISGNLDLPANFSAANNVKVYTATCSGTDEGGNLTFADRVEFPTASVIVTNNKTVNVSNFDYKENYVTGENGTGKKLIVTITGLLPNRDGADMPSNESTSGIYDDGHLVAPFEIPAFSVDLENRVVDFGMTVNIADHVLNSNAATNQYGTFALDNEAYTYNLNSVSNGNGNYTFGFTGVDSSLYFADGSWNKVNVIPANNVYYDDTFLNGDDTGSSTFTDGKYGYEANVDVATSAGSFTPEGSTTALTAKTTFKFTGSRIDLYCTTTSNSNAVVAALWKAEDFGKDDTQPVASKYMINTYESGTLYNVPTLSFDTGVRGNYVLVLYANGSSNYQLDGVRVYNPGNADVENLYNADEKNATFTKVRDLLLEANSFNEGDASVNGVVYTDQIREDSHNTTVIDTYKKVGPKNEVYLAKDNAIAFKVDDYQPGMTVMIGLSAPEATAAGTIQVTNNTNTKDIEIKSNVDMYYEVTPTADGCVVIRNNSDALISVTNVKLSGAAEAEAAALSVDDGLLTYMASFNTLEVTEPDPVDPEPTPDTPVQNDTISAIIHAIWAQVKTSIDRLFGRL